ncbi:N,N-dimethylformamidase large subunit (plasmid) [Sulfitobacter sp. SK012]|uniref:N,N-dimethylformamidase beta subunit family domain-containing protein n=1 Tax=Sulfitobacter sp. SK012 TaxID=1389005 RepID=UPI000E0CA1E3|nr:N,N-dimethylformamidase beta subunit family domain-containing protein [Sulfitobacter sp. SK012]AXI49148.1 N,N-dimethylformamidase large subunit [Sulfitobacter sp. SK012]
MATHLKDIPLLGYVDRLSGRPGDTFNFKVSSTSAKPFQAHLMRSISADPNPEGPGIVEEDASPYFKKSTYPSVHRPFAAGSYGIGQTNVTATPASEVALSARIYPTLRSAQAQTIVGIGRYDLRIDPDGAISLAIDGRTITLGKALTLRRWYDIQARITHDTISLAQIPIGHRAEAAQNETREGIPDLALFGRPTLAAHLIDAKPAQHFNGKIEAPKVTVDGQLLCQWDLSRDISSCIVPAQAGPNLTLVNYPARAVTGSAWNGSEMNWTHKPAHYAAIHFHQDDIYDFGWDTDFTYTLPDDIPSGVYIMRIGCEEFEDAIPFFVCPPLGKPKAKLCVLVSTFTYAIYGNHARPDYKPSWQDRISDWDAYPYNPAEHPEYGLSTYNYHADGSGICHASHKRPLFNLKPGYFTFGEADCSGLRHFPADMHLISWLHAMGINYDIVTDRELHDDGAAAIAGYSAVTTGTHPEYHTSETLNALRDYRDGGGHLLYLGGNGFYWRIALHPESEDMLEIRRAEDGIRAWAAEPGEYYNAFDGTYGGLWRRNGRAPQDLVGIGFAAQGEFFGDPYRRVCTDAAYDWVFEGVKNTLIGNYGYSGNGAAGFELDHMDYTIGTPQNTVLLAQSVTRDNGFMLVPEEQLTHLTNLSGGSAKDAMHADMVLINYPGGGSVFSTGSITFCGSLPWNNFDNDVSQLLKNVVARVLPNDV